MNLKKIQRVQHLKAMAAAGDITLPRVDPNDSAALTRLSPLELECVAAGLYVYPHDSGDPVRLPPGWDGEKLRRVQADYPDQWQSIVNSMCPNV